MAGRNRPGTSRSTSTGRANRRTRAAPLTRAAPVFAALGDRTRLRLVGRLGADGPLSIASLTAGTDVSRQAVTKHLRVLASVGLARDARKGRERVWSLDPAPLEEARRSLDQIELRWDEALERLRAVVED